MRLRQLEGENARLRKMVVEQAVVEFATAFSAHGQVSASKKRDIFVSPSGVRSIWFRHNLSSMKQRLTALEKMSAN